MTIRKCRAANKTGIEDVDVYGLDKTSEDQHKGIYASTARRRRTGRWFERKYAFVYNIRVVISKDREI
jgi:hypothetical protein